MAAAKIKKGDRVIVLSGKDKGKTGEVTAAMPKDGKVVVSGVNVAVRHRKPSQTNPQGGLERVEELIDHGRTGFLATHKDPVALANCIEAALGEAGERCAVVTASGTSFPSLTNGSADPSGAKQ